MAAISSVSNTQSAMSPSVEAHNAPDHSSEIAGLEALLGKLIKCLKQLGSTDKAGGGGANGQPATRAANETSASSNAQEVKGRREGDHADGRQGMQQPNGYDETASQQSDQASKSQKASKLSASNGASPSTISTQSGDVPALEDGGVASSFSKSRGNTTQSVATTAGGMVGEGTHALRPVPQNGGAKSEKPTTVEDVNAVIKDIDPSLLTDPSQKGEERLKNLPYGKMFEAAGQATGIDPALLYGTAQVETGNNVGHKVLEPNNINPIQTAPGVWPTTENAATNLFTGAFVMKDYINQAGGDLKMGINAYNTGNVSPSEKGFAHGFDGYYEGVMSAYANVENAIKDPSIVGPGQGGNVSAASQI